MKKLFWCVLFLAVACSYSTVYAQKTKYHYLMPTMNADEILALDNKMERLYYMLLGHFDNKEQADTSTVPFIKHQEFIAVPLWREQRKGEYWLAFAWYKAGNLEEPLVQFVYKLAKKDRDTFYFERYFIPDEMRNTDWAKSDPYSKFKPQDLRKSDCLMLLYPHPTEPNAYQMNMPTEDDYCSGDVGTRGYAYVRMLVDISPVMWNLRVTFYDKDYKVLFSYKDIGNRYKRLPKNQPKYLDILYKKK